jgi:hypothetical protein
MLVSGYNAVVAARAMFDYALFLLQIAVLSPVWVVSPTGGSASRRLLGET